MAGRHRTFAVADLVAATYSAAAFCCRAPTVAGCRLLVVMGWTRFTSRQLLYLRWKTRVIGFCSGLTTLTSMVPSAARV
jgi:hypothetical protein